MENAAWRRLLTRLFTRAPAPDTAAAVSATQAEPGFVTMTLPDGASYRLSIAEGQRDAYHSAVAVQGVHDENWHFLRAWLRPGEVFFDLGANIGTISIPAAATGSIVHAFELLDENVRHLVRAVQRNALTTMSIVVGAVSDHVDYVGIGGTSAWGTVVPAALVSIPTVVIDSYVERKAIAAVAVMKIDVEGSENVALRGAAGLIARDHPDILLECNAATCGNHGYSYRELLRFLIERGYDIYRLHGNRLCPWTPDRVQEVIYDDYFATAKPPAEVTGRSGWRIDPLTDAEIVASILKQALYGDLHKQYVLAIRHMLPRAILADEAVAAMLARWTALDDPAVAGTLQTGSA